MKDFAEVAAPLHALMGKYVCFQWNDECQVAFHRLKAALMSSPILAMPTDGDVYVLNTEASEQSIGAELSRKQGREKVIAYASHTYSRAEQNYGNDEGITGGSLLYEAVPAISAGNPFFCPDGSRRLNVVTEGDRLDGQTRSLARVSSGIRIRHRTPSRA